MLIGAHSLNPSIVFATQTNSKKPKTMNLNSIERQSISNYLEAVSKCLRGPNREETLEDIESHIHESIAARLERGEREGVVDAILAEMDPPDAYRSATLISEESKICRLAILGILLLPFGHPVLWHFMRLTPYRDSVGYASFYNSMTFYAFVLPVGAICVMMSMVLGWLAGRQIRSSEGTVTGMPLAVISATLYPVLLLNLFLFIAVANMLGSRGFMPYVYYGIPLLILILVGNGFVFRQVTRAMENGTSIVQGVALPIVVYIGLMALLIFSS